MKAYQEFLEERGLINKVPEKGKLLSTYLQDLGVEQKRHSGGKVYMYCILKPS